jgi:hypothetical protein
MKNLDVVNDPEEGTTDEDGTFHPTKPPVHGIDNPAVPE